MKIKLSIAVLPEGNLVEKVTGDCQVTLEGNGSKALTHIPGCYLFINLLPGEYKVVAEGSQYEKKEAIVNVSGQPSWLVKLKPEIEVKALIEPATIILKGKVIHKNSGDNVEGATVQVEKTDFETITDNEGDFEFELPYVGEESLEIRLQVRKEGFKKRRPAVDLVAGGVNETLVELIPKA